MALSSVVIQLDQNIKPSAGRSIPSWISIISPTSKKSQWIETCLESRHTVTLFFQSATAFSYINCRSFWQSLTAVTVAQTMTAMKMAKPSIQAVSRWSASVAVCKAIERAAATKRMRSMKSSNAWQKSLKMPGGCLTFFQLVPQIVFLAATEAQSVAMPWARWEFNLAASQLISSPASAKASMSSAFSLCLYFSMQSTKAQRAIKSSSIIINYEYETAEKQFCEYEHQKSTTQQLKTDCHSANLLFMPNALFELAVSLKVSLIQFSNIIKQISAQFKISNAIQTAFVSEMFIFYRDLLYQRQVNTGLYCHISQLECTQTELCYKMINKIKQSAVHKKQSLKSRISLILQFEDCQRLSQIELKKRHTLISTGRTLRSPFSNNSKIRMPTTAKQQKKYYQDKDQMTKSRESDFKDKLLLYIKKVKLKEKPQNKQPIPGNSYVPKIKHKKTKQHYRKSLPSFSLEQSLSPRIEKSIEKQAKVSQIFIGSTITKFNKTEQGFSRSNNIQMLLADGRKKRVDSVMFLRKLKTKNDLSFTIFTQTNEKKFYDRCYQQKTLFLPKDLATCRRSNFPQTAKKAKKSLAQNQMENPQKTRLNFRPWSAARSEQDE